MNKTISLPPSYIERLANEKKKTGLSASETIRRALDLYFQVKISNEVR